MDLLQIHNPPELIEARLAAIRQTLLTESATIKQPNFERIAVGDLARMFSLYDREFFGGWLAPAVVAKTGVPPAFRLSNAMTRAGGKTIKYAGRRGPRGFYEIALAARMLFMTFRDDTGRLVIVCGLACRDRLAAMQRIVEHEMIHLAEHVMWDESSCAQVRFKKLARNIFGHTDTKHGLVTPRQDAAVRHGVRVGSAVEFKIGGTRLAGRVNRISRRATVLVEDTRGIRYTDGGTYLKYYVPLEMLLPVTAGRQN